MLILLVVLPILWLVGIIVVGTWLGSYIIKPTDTGRAIGAAVLGTLIVSLVSLIPFVAIITTIAAILGSGAFVYRTIKNRNATELPSIAGLADRVGTDANRKRTGRSASCRTGPFAFGVPDESPAD